MELPAKVHWELVFVEKGS